MPAKPDGPRVVLLARDALAGRCRGADSTACFNRLKCLTEKELRDFSKLSFEGCVSEIIEAQHVDRNHSPEG
jgi:hypothetical protein